MTGLKTLINGLKTWVSTRKIDEKQIPESIARVKDIPQGGGVQANLDQNDPAAPDYVKGRTHWVEMGESTCTAQAGENRRLEGFPIFTIGEVVIVTVDSAEYTFVAYDDDGCVTVGDSYNDIDRGTGTYGWQIYAYDHGEGIEMYFYSKDSHTVVYKAELVHKIHKKYIPESDIGKIGLGPNSVVFNECLPEKNMGTASFTEGYQCEAFGNYVHAEGYYTQALADYSHSEGNSTVVTGRFSHVEGFHTIASGESQHVQGQYNIDDEEGKYLHIVGNGRKMGSDYRVIPSNAHTLDWDGNAWYQGDIYIGSTSGTNKDEGSRKLIPSPTTLTAGSLLMYDGTDWVSITKEALIEEIIAALPTWTGGSY